MPQEFILQQFQGTRLSIAYVKLLWSLLFPSSLFLFFALSKPNTAFTQQLLTRNSTLQHHPEVQKRHFHGISSLEHHTRPARFVSLPQPQGEFSNHLFLPAAKTQQEIKPKQSEEQLLCLSTGLPSLLIWSKVLLRKGNGQVWLLPNCRPYVVVITCGKVCLSHGEETCWSVASEEKEDVLINWRPLYAINALEVLSVMVI